MAEVLPFEIIELEILPRLPMKSINRFLCVCKQWRSFLETREFNELHCRHKLKSHIHKLLIVERPPWNSFSLLDYEASGERGLADFPPFPLECCSLRVLASLDGILLCAAIIGSIIGSTCKLVFWNPLTGDYKRLPSLKNQDVDDDSEGSNIHEDAFGIYIDKSCNDYKLLRVNYTGVYIYSRRQDSWRKIQDLENSYYFISMHRSWSRATFFGKGLYFTVKRLIICFDVKSEKFREIQYPPIFVEHGVSFCGSLLVIKDCIHLCVAYGVSREKLLGESAKIDLWRMDGRTGGWINVVMAFSGIQRMALRWKPISVTNDGEWLVTWYHMISNQEGFTREQLCLYSASSLLKGVTYVESLLSPNPKFISSDLNIENAS